jgi:hypothetical protein
VDGAKDEDEAPNPEAGERCTALTSFDVWQPGYDSWKSDETPCWTGF